MIIPYFWADSRLQEKRNSKQITIKRWGWSDISQQEAQDLANQRARDAMEKAHMGESLIRREPIDSYGSSQGVPIREEVVSRHGEIIVTRNSYGSLCLNTPNVLFADVDSLPPKKHFQFNTIGCFSILVLASITAAWCRSPWIGIGIITGMVLAWQLISQHINKRNRQTHESRFKQDNLNSIRSFASANPEWHLRVYETPAGYRLLAMHDVFEPRCEATQAALNAMNSDRRFIVLCALQACFRARVSPKPWRMNYTSKESLPKSKWPFKPQHLPIRERWLINYNANCPRYASCRFIERLGSDTIHPDAEAVRDLHDTLCQANTSLPLA